MPMMSDRCLSKILLIFVSKYTRTFHIILATGSQKKKNILVKQKKNILDLYNSYTTVCIQYTHYKCAQTYHVLGNFRSTKFSQTQHLRIFAVLNYSRMQNFKFADLTLDFILVQQYVIPYKLCIEKWLLCLLAWLLVCGTVINTSANCCS